MSDQELGQIIGFLVGVAVLVIGGGIIMSMLYDWLRARLVSRVSEKTPIHSVNSPQQTSRQTAQTDQQTPRLSATPPKPPRFAVDRTRQAVLDELLTHGWTVADLRREGIFRGDNATVGQEVAETRKRLGLSDPDRTLKIRDEKGERRIAFDSPKT